MARRSLKDADAPPLAALTPSLDSEYRRLPLDMLFETPLNPRKRINQAKLEDLAASIREHDVIEPAVVRPSLDEPGKFEVVAGARRFRATKLAGRDTLPCIIRPYSDHQVLEVALIENDQREDVHPIEQAEAYERLMHADALATVEAIALRLGRSLTYVRDRLRLLRLVDVCREAYLVDAITSAHAERLAKLSAEQQPDALAACFAGLLAFEDDAELQLPRDEAEEAVADAGGDIAVLIHRRDWARLGLALQGVGALDEWVTANGKTDVAGDPDVRQQVLDQLGQADAESSAMETMREEDPVASLLQLSASEEFDYDRKTAKAAGLVHHDDWKVIERADARCPYARMGAVVHGGDLRVVEVCASKRCERHFPKPKKAAGGSSTPNDYIAQQRKEDERRATQDAAWKALKPHACAAIAALAAKVKFNAALVGEVVDPGEQRYIVGEFGIKLTDKTAAQVLALSTITTWNRESFERSAKPFKFDLKKLEAQLAKAAKAKPAAPAKGKKAKGKKAA